MRTPTRFLPRSDKDRRAVGWRVWPLAGGALVLAAATTVAPGCKGCATHAPLEDAPGLAAVTVKPVPSIVVAGQTVTVDGGAVEDKIRAQLEASGLFAAPEPQRPAGHVSVQAELLDATDAKEPVIGVKVRLRVAVRPTNPRSAHFADDVEGMGEVPLAGGTADQAFLAFQKLLERTSRDLVESYIARQKLWQAPASAIDAALRSKDNEMRVEALRIIATRVLPGWNEALLPLLSDEDENVRDAALGAVVALHEQRAVKLLAQSRSMRDTREMGKIINAIAVLGGREARDYLGFVAQNHDDADVRAIAKQALDKMAGSAKASDQPTK